jgi:NAD+ synthetase
VLRAQADALVAGLDLSPTYSGLLLRALPGALRAAQWASGYAAMLLWLLSFAEAALFLASTFAARSKGASVWGLAAALGGRFHTFDVEPLVRGYEALVAAALGRPLAWERDDVALQNIQARVRAPGVWMLANITGGLLVSTSNRSEAAVGYATMDGDTSGGIAPIAGIDKAYLRRWLVWVERQGPAGLGPIPALAAVNAQAPTAELRPEAAGQTDEADLMPYDVLDAIERFAIRDKQTPVEAWQRRHPPGKTEAPTRSSNRWKPAGCRTFRRSRKIPGACPPPAFP